MKIAAILQTILLLLAVTAHAETALSPTGLSPLEGLIKEALESNPELRVYDAASEAAMQKPSQVRSLDDPRLGFAISNLPVDTFSFDQEAMTQKQISVKQKFPFPGKLNLKGSIAEREMDIAKEEYDEKKNSIISRVKIAYNKLLFVQKALYVTINIRGLLTEIIKTAETKYAVGDAGQLDVVKAQMQLSGMIRKTILLEQQKDTAVARINTLLNRPLLTHIDTAGTLTRTPLNMTFADLVSTAEETRPALSGLEHKIERSRLAGRLAEKEYYPDIDFGISYGQRDDNDRIERADFVSASVTVNIPLWYKTKESRKVLEEKAKKRMAVEQYNSMKNSMNFRIKELIAEIDMYGQEIELYRTGFIPQSELSYEAALSGYKVNRAGFSDLINSQITLYNHRVDYYRAIVNHENKLAELEATIGKRIY
jgi:outer membrane protein TolC